MQVRIGIELGAEFYQLENASQANLRAKKTNQAVYCWKTAGRSNWLERGLSITDVLGLVVLPKSLPSIIEMPDD